MQLALLAGKKIRYQSYLWGVVMLALACYLAVELGLQFTFLSPHVSLFNLATGVGVGALIVYGIRYWPGVLLGVTFGYYLNQEAASLAVAVATGVTLEAVVSAYILKRFFHLDNSLEYIPDILKLLLISGSIVTVLGATYLSMTLLAFGKAGPAELGFIWINSLLGKITGIALITPFVMVWSQKLDYEEDWSKVLELACMIISLIICGGIVFFGWFDTNIGGYSRYPLAYIFFPILAWAAFRFGQRVATAATIIIASFALWSLSKHLGPFWRDSIYESHFLTWLCINMASILAMILAADITQCKKVRVALQKSDERLDLATGGSQDGLWDWTDIKQDRMWWSSNFYELLGYKEGEITPSSQQLFDLMHADDKRNHDKVLADHLKGKCSYNVDYRLRTRSGVYRWFHVKAEVIYDVKTGARRMAGSIIDIHDRKLAQEEVTKLNKELEQRVIERTHELADINSDLRREIMQRNKAELEIVKLQNDLIRMGRISTMGEMASALAHELHQPLMAIVNYSQSALMDLNKSNQVENGVIDDIENVSEQALRGGEIIRKMKDFAIKGKTATARVDINELILELKPLFDIEAAQSRIKLSVRLVDEELIVDINSIQMQQVLSNMVRNGIEAMKYNTTDKLLTIATRRIEEEYVAIDIIDSGAGIREDQMEDVFESFYTTKSDGLGLGLSISEKIVKAHYGQLTLRNKSSGGVTARITLPLAIDQ